VFVLLEFLRLHINHERLLWDELHLVGRRGQYQPRRITADGMVDGRHPPVHEGLSPCDIGEGGASRAFLSRVTTLCEAIIKDVGVKMERLVTARAVQRDRIKQAYTESFIAALDSCMDGSQFATSPGC